nr:inverse autotransporter beta domain-containing protein [Enterobacter asburiae]HDJ1437573.1 inverse autotransporter beta domain-containing protein [Enterobacter asburiae]
MEQFFSPLSVAFTAAIASAVQANRDRRRERQSGRRTPCPGRDLPEQRPRYRCRCITRQRVPLYDSHDLLTFAQGGIRRAEDRTQSSLGLGVHSFGHDSMLGANAFIDHDLSRRHTRAGLGATTCALVPTATCTSRAGRIPRTSLTTLSARQTAGT